MQNPYQTLGIPQGATLDEAKKAYRRLARKYHPDVSKEPDAEEKFKEVQAAYDAIKNPQKQQHHRHYHNPSAGFGGGDPFEDILRQWGFDINGGGVHVRQVRTVQLNISLEEAYRGVTREVNGAKVQLPAGVRTGTRFTLSQELRMVVNVTGHPRFQRNNDDLMLRAQISMSQAVLGCELEIRHLDGKTYSAKIPGGIQNGQTIRLTGKGMPNPQWPERSGDLFVQVTVIVPKPDELTDEQRQALKTINYQERANA